MSNLQKNVEIALKTRRYIWYVTALTLPVPVTVSLKNSNLFKFTRTFNYFTKQIQYLKVHDYCTLKNDYLSQEASKTKLLPPSPTLRLFL